MKIIFLIVAIVACCFRSSFAQWPLVWTSSGIDTSTVTGWISLNATENGQRFYMLDTQSFRIMTSATSQTAQYTYTFNAAEQLAGEQIYSFSLDLTGDGISDFYILSWYGMTSPYRQAFRIFDIVTNTTIFEANDPQFSYGYPSIWDANGDGQLECTFARNSYPATSTFLYEVHQTGIMAVDLAGQPQIPRQIDLHQNYPNPFNPETSIGYELNSSGQVRVDVFNIAGQKVETLVNESQTPGLHSVRWNGGGSASGTYFYQMHLNEKPVSTKKMQLIK